MREDARDARIVQATREIAATPAVIFELIADPALQPRWDGNDNLTAAAPSQRVHGVGAVFAMELTTGALRHNHVSDGSIDCRAHAVPTVATTTVAAADSTIVIPGAAGGLSQLARLLLRRGVDAIAVEEPGFPFHHAILRRDGLQRAPVPSVSAGSSYRSNCARRWPNNAAGRATSPS